MTFHVESLKCLSPPALHITLGLSGKTQQPLPHLSASICNQPLRMATSSLSLHLRWLTVTIIAVIVTLLIQNQKTARIGQLSKAGQTLVDLRNALENAKSATGSYPDTFDNLQIKDAPSSGDFSAPLLKQVIYIKTDTSFIAILGVDAAVSIRPGESPVFHGVK